jgi:hypothetical protein
MPHLSTFSFLLSTLLVVFPALAGARFEVSSPTPQPPGRLFVLITPAPPDSKPSDSTPPAANSILREYDYSAGLDATFKDTTATTLDDTATHQPIPPSKLPPGKYLAQAVLDLHRQDSEWRREPGNLFSPPTPFTVVEGQTTTVPLALTNTVQPRPNQTTTAPTNPDFHIFEIKSDLLSAFYNKDIYLKAGVLIPKDHDPAKAYPTIYEVPGFGGDGMRPPRMWRPTIPPELATGAFYIALNPESENGHTLFANSANNGPRADALIQELLPALEKKYNLIPHPSARLLRGHSSGGWSTLWLASQYPATFGATWSTSPDPVDFRKFELINIYQDPNFYYYPDGSLIPSEMNDGKVTLTVKAETAREEPLGARNTSGQQWDSWMSVWGSRAPDGHIADLYDVSTGAIHHAEAEHYKQYDIALLLRQDPQRYLPIFQQNVRLICGLADNYYLHEAIILLNQDIQQLSEKSPPPPNSAGYIKLLPKYDHSDIYSSPELRNIPAEMLTHLRNAGHLK